MLFRAFVLSFCLFICAPALALVVDHQNIDQVAGLPQSTMDLIAEQSWYFMHASVGQNMINGMNALTAMEPTRYQLAVSSIGDNPPPPDPDTGVVFENHRGNPPWDVKIAMFEEAVADLGWRAPSVSVVMNKLCYDDWAADAEVYLASMVALEAEYPATTFVYTTEPLRVNEDGTNALRTVFNEAIRAYCVANNRLLFDIADIESHDPDGNPVTYEYNGQVYPKLYSGYTDDGGHLNSDGAMRVALGWYATAAAITGNATAAPGTPAAWDAIRTIAPNPFNPVTTITFDLQEDRLVDVSIFDARGRFVTQLQHGTLPSGEHAVTWRGVDIEGRGVGSGTYTVRLRSGDRVSTKQMSLVR